MPQDFEVRSEVLKVDDELGVVYSWAIICAKNGKPYFDLQGDHIPQDEMLKMAVDFMLNSRVMDDMHDEKDAGRFVFAWPMTADIAKAFNMELPVDPETSESIEGFMTAFKPFDDSVLKKFKSGEYTGLSLGGWAQRIPVNE